MGLSSWCNPECLGLDDLLDKTLLVCEVYGSLLFVVIHFNAQEFTKGAFPDELEFRYELIDHGMSEAASPSSSTQQITNSRSFLCSRHGSRVVEFKPSACNADSRFSYHRRGATETPSTLFSRRRHVLPGWI